MRASRLVVATSHPNGIITLSGMGDNSISIEGTSIANVPKDISYNNSHSLSIGQGETGIVALGVFVKIGQGKNMQVDNYYFFLGITWEKDKPLPRIDLETEWVPADPARLGYLNRGNLEIVIDDITYSTNHLAKDDEKWYVPNTNLFCRYMDGKITKEQFLEEAGAPAKQADKIAELQATIAELEHTKNILGDKARNAEDDRKRLKAVLSCRIIEVVRWREAAMALKRAVTLQLFRGKAVRNALKGYPETSIDLTLMADCALAGLSGTEIPASAKS